ncbi:hypothetical protein [uncultured Aquimarina sp.]|uniref:hypothetical protein n=1 Tax=uncultured Aquimarina sp. TaxID=575652 RepID=UPI002620E25A|nr:hypothetical protein [uncultured Aquimarina sp.]
MAKKCSAFSGIPMSCRIAGSKMDKNTKVSNAPIPSTKNNSLGFFLKNGTNDDKI